MDRLNRSRLFMCSCVALVTTSMVFSIRADILDALGGDFHLTKEQIGVILSPAFLGFTLSILIGGSLVDFFGMRRLLLLSSLGFALADTVARLRTQGASWAAIADELGIGEGTVRRHANLQHQHSRSV